MRLVHYVLLATLALDALVLLGRADQSSKSERKRQRRPKIRRTIKVHEAEPLPPPPPAADESASASPAAQLPSLNSAELSNMGPSNQVEVNPSISVQMQPPPPPQQQPMSPSAAVQSAAKGEAEGGQEAGKAFKVGDAAGPQVAEVNQVEAEEEEEEEEEPAGGGAPPAQPAPAAVVSVPVSVNQEQSSEAGARAPEAKRREQAPASGAPPEQKYDRAAGSFRNSGNSEHIELDNVGNTRTMKISGAGNHEHLEFTAPPAGRPRPQPGPEVGPVYAYPYQVAAYPPAGEPQPQPQPPPPPQSQPQPQPQPQQTPTVIQIHVDGPQQPPPPQPQQPATGSMVQGVSALNKFIVPVLEDMSLAEAVALGRGVREALAAARLSPRPRQYMMVQETPLGAYVAQPLIVDEPERKRPSLLAARLLPHLPYLRGQLLRRPAPAPGFGPGHPAYPTRWMRKPTRRPAPAKPEPASPTTTALPLPASPSVEPREEVHEEEPEEEDEEESAAEQTTTSTTPRPADKPEVEQIEWETVRIPRRRKTRRARAPADQPST